MEISAGNKHGLLTAIEPAPRLNGKRAWLFRCDCGKLGVKEVYRVTRGIIISCGCWGRARALDAAHAAATIHGATNTRLFRTWDGMIQRCTNPNGRQWHRYGGRGIHVCTHWLNSFENFRADMGEPPSQAHSLDRINNNGSYEPGNCRWATTIEQARNRRTNVIIEIDGQKKTIAEWATISGLRFGTLAQRVKRGWQGSRLINTPPDTYPGGRDLYVIEVDGIRRTPVEWERATGIKRNTISERIKHGWSAREAVSIPARKRSVSK